MLLVHSPQPPSQWLHHLLLRSAKRWPGHRCHQCFCRRWTHPPCGRHRRSRCHCLHHCRVGCPAKDCLGEGEPDQLQLPPQCVPRGSVERSLEGTYPSESCTPAHKRVSLGLAGSTNIQLAGRCINLNRTRCSDVSECTRSSPIPVNLHYA